MKIAELFTELTVKDTGFNRVLKSAKDQADKVSLSFDKVAEKASRLLAVQGVAAGFILKIASDYEEAGAKFEAVFKEETAAANNFAETLSEKVGRSAEDVRRSMSALQDTFVPLGFARKEARKLSQQLSQLSIDVASFNNVADEDTLRDFQSALVGNHETVRKYGIIITQAALDQELLNMGFDGGAKSATEMQKVLARLNIIMNGTSDAQGDAEKTAGSLANQFRALIGQAKDLANALGKLFVPAAKDVVSGLKGIAETARSFAEVSPALTKFGLIAGVGATALALFAAKLPFIIVGLKMMKTAFLAISVAGAALVLKVTALGAALLVVVAAIKDLITGSDSLGDIWWRLKSVFGEKDEKSTLISIWEKQLEAGKIRADEFLDRIHALKKLQEDKKPDTKGVMGFGDGSVFDEQIEKVKRLREEMANARVEEPKSFTNVFEEIYKIRKRIADQQLKSADDLEKSREKQFQDARRDREEERQAAKESFSEAISREQSKKRSLEQELKKASEIKRASLVSTSDISRQVQVAVAGKRDNEQVTLLNKQIKNQTSIIEVLKKQLDAILNPLGVVSE
jgi:hypothetical protein